MAQARNALWQVALWCAVLATAAFWPTALDRWVLPKDLVVGAAALIGIWVAPRGRLPRWTVAILLGAIVVVVVTTLSESMPLSALLGRWPRFEGILTGSAYLLALWLGARLLGPSSTTGERRSFTSAISALSILIGALSVLEFFGLRPLSSDLSRPGSLLGNATDQGAIGAVCALLLIIPVLRAQRPLLTRATLLTVCGLGSGLATVIISASRASLLALMIGLVIIGFREVMRRTQKRRAVAVVAVALGVLSAIALLSPTLGPRLLGGSAFGASTIGDRILIWGESIRLAMLHPLWGAGPSGYSDAIIPLHGTNWFNTVGQSITLDSPHNIVIQSLMVGGPVLAILFLVGLVLLVRVSITKTGVARPHADFAVSTAVALLSLVLVLFTHVTSPGTVVLGALLAGSLVSVAQSNSIQSTATQRRAFGWLPRPTSLSWRLRLSAVIFCWMLLLSTTLAGEVALSDGRLAAFAGDIPTATAKFSEARALRPWDVDTTITAAESLTARLDKDDPNALQPALEFSTDALQLAPDSLAAAKASVTAHLAAGDLVNARTTLEHFTQFMPNQPWIAHRLAVVTLLEGDLAGAEKQLLHAIELNETNADPWLTLAYVYSQQGRDLEAANATARAQSLSAKP